MSIKSQKSLEEECSEIFEKSYSVRSLSDESLSGSNEDEILARELLHKISPAVLSKLRRCFKRRKHKDKPYDIDRRVEEVMRVAAAEEGIEFVERPQPRRDKTLWIDEEEFVATINNIFGHHKYSTHARKLFSQLDPFRTRRIWWGELLGRLVEEGGARNRGRADCWARLHDAALAVKQLAHCKRETIVKLVSIESRDSFCYAAISKGGRVGLYSGALVLLDHYNIFYHRTGLKKRIKNCWVTDALYMTDVGCLVISSSDRSLIVYDASTLTHTPTYCITGLPNIPTCLTYDASDNRTGPSELMFGDERGNITRLRFLQPSLSLLYKKYSDKINFYFWMELPSPPHDVYCSVAVWRRVHGRSVRRLYYCRRQDVVVSCSHDADASLVIRHRKGILEDYTFKFPRGVSCFHASAALRAVAAGAADGAVRLLAPGAAAGRPLRARGARAPVLDVAIVAHLQIVLAYSKNCSIDIWDLYEECCLQTIKIKFPFLGILGKRVEFGTYSIHPGPGRVSLNSEVGDNVLDNDSSKQVGTDDDKSREYWEPDDIEKDIEYIRFNKSDLVITSNDYVCVIPLGHVEPQALLPPPHKELLIRRPSIWEQNASVLRPGSSISNYSVTKITPRVPITSSPRDVDPVPVASTSEVKVKKAQSKELLELDSLLKKADLQDLMEKDFVQMMGLKQDINRKITEMEANLHKMSGPVSMCAPYLALTLYEPEPVHLPIDLEDKYRRVLRLFPSSPSVSVTSTPRTNRTRTPRKSR